MSSENSHGIVAPLVTIGITHVQTKPSMIAVNPSQRTKSTRQSASANNCREMWRNLENYREMQEMQTNANKCREMQRNVEKCREIQRNAEK